MLYNLKGSPGYKKILGGSQGYYSGGHSNNLSLKNGPNICLVQQFELAFVLSEGTKAPACVRFYVFYFNLSILGAFHLVHMQYYMLSGPTHPLFACNTYTVLTDI